jgi:hypothetical protein
VDNFVGDRLVRHGWGGSFGASSVARLFRKGVKSWKTERVHPGTTFTGVFGGRLENAILHKVDDDIADMVQRLNRYTALRGQDLADSGKIKSLWNDLFRGVRRFFKCYVSRKGYREGDMGFLIADHGRPVSVAVEPQGAGNPLSGQTRTARRDRRRGRWAGHGNG